LALESRSMSASSRAWMAWFRRTRASPRYLKGSACSLSPDWPAKVVTLPRAMTRWSYSSWSWREPTPAARVTRRRPRWISSMAGGGQVDTDQALRTLTVGADDLAVHVL